MMINIKKILVFSFLLVSVELLPGDLQKNAAQFPDKEAVVLKASIPKEAKKVENVEYLKKAKVEEVKQEPQDPKTKATRGYFGIKTNFYDKDGKAKLLSKDFKSLTFDELDHNRNVLIRDSFNDKESLVRYTERMITLCKDSKRLRELRKDAADYHFENKRFDKSAAFYQEYKKMYPGSAEYEYSSFRNILSVFAQILPSDRDPAMVKETHKLAKEFLDNPNFNKFRPQVKRVYEDCRQRLLDAELNNFNFYLKKNNIKAAQLRMDYIKDNFFKEPASDKFILGELQKQIDAAKDKKYYEPKYEVTTNSNLWRTIFGKREESSKQPFRKQKKIVKQDKIDYAARF